MSVNKYRPHVLVLPEDDANRQLATGFELEVTKHRNMQVLVEAGGWTHVQELFLNEHVKAMRQYPERYLVLLLDFDNQSERCNAILEKVPEDLKLRVFVLGVQSEPEALRRDNLGSFEQIGRTLAKECRDGQHEVWSHSLLNQNAPEISRLKQAVSNIIF